MNAEIEGGRIENVRFGKGHKPQRIVFRQQAADGTLYAPDAFESQIGKTLPFTVGDWTGPATLRAAEVVDVGRAVLLTVDTEDMPDGAFWQAISP